MSYILHTPETFLYVWMVRDKHADPETPPQTKQVSQHSAWKMAAIVIAAVVSLAARSSAEEIIAVVDRTGRRVFVNMEDTELRLAVERGGAQAAGRLIEKRKQALPGIDRHIENVARRHALDPELVRAVIQVESAWNPRARSRKGALGLMQLMPATGARYGVRDPFDPRENISGGARHLRFLLNRFGGDRRLALAAYNAGENAVDANRGVPPYRETHLYLERVETIYGKLRAGRIPRIGRIYKLVDQNGRTVFVND